MFSALVPFRSAALAPAPVRAKTCRSRPRAPHDWSLALSCPLLAPWSLPFVAVPLPSPVAVSSLPPLPRFGSPVACALRRSVASFSPSLLALFRSLVRRPSVALRRRSLRHHRRLARRSACSVGTAVLFASFAPFLAALPRPSPRFRSPGSPLSFVRLARPLRSPFAVRRPWASDLSLALPPRPFVRLLGPLVRLLRSRAPSFPFAAPSFSSSPLPRCSSLPRGLRRAPRSPLASPFAPGLSRSSPRVRRRALASPSVPRFSFSPLRGPSRSRLPRSFSGRALHAWAFYWRVWWGGFAWGRCAVVPLGEGRLRLRVPLLLGV